MAEHTSDTVLQQEPANGMALAVRALLANRNKNESKLKLALEGVLANAKSLAMAQWALNGLNKVYAQAGQRIHFFSLRNEPKKVEFSSRFQSRTGLKQEFTEAGMVLSGAPAKDTDALVKFGLRVNGREFIRALITVTVDHGVQEAGLWVGRSAARDFVPPSLQVGVAKSQLQTRLVLDPQSGWQPVGVPLDKLTGGRTETDKTTITYQIELVDPVNGVFTVSVNGTGIGRTPALIKKFRITGLGLQAGGFVRGNKDIPYSVRFENLVIVQRGAQEEEETIPGGLIKTTP